MSWIIAGVVGLAMVAPQIDRAVSVPDAHAQGGGFYIPRAPDGQFYSDAKVGGVPVRLLVDNGIDDVVLAADDALRLGLDPAAGAVTLPSLAIGPTTLRDVQARIAPDLPVSLLGRAFLTRVAGAEIRRDRLVLR